MPEKTRYAELPKAGLSPRPSIGRLIAENLELREQIADIILETASLREKLEDKKTRH